MKKPDSLRIHAVIVCIILLFGLVIYRLFVLSYNRHQAYARTAQAQTESMINVLARGNIYLQDKVGGTVLAAANKKFPVVSIIPKKVPADARAGLALKIKEIIDVSEAVTEEILKTDSANSKVISKHITLEQAEKIKALGITGVGIAYVNDRYYPQENLAADVLGFLGYSGDDRIGQYGIEAYYNDALYGKSEKYPSLISGGIFGRLLSSFSGSSSPAPTPNSDQPKDIILTIDKNIQTFAEQTLQGVITQWSASGGSVIVQDPLTGKILAMADRPAFNPNSYREAKTEFFLNSAVQEIFEPGSSFKPITMAAGLDTNKITPETTYTDTGVVEVAGYPIRNFDQKAHGVNTMTQVLEKSLNTGTMFVQNLIGNDAFLNYIINMGFGQKTGVDLPGEVSGDITNLYSGRKINYLTASFGQGIAVTTLQLITAYSAIANGGKLMKPYIVDKIMTQGGGEEISKPEIVGTPITPRTAARLRAMLVSVVDNGFDKARIKGYEVAGKTGTAQIPDAKGGYEENEFIHNFIGFAPASDPKFVIMIKMDRPKGINFAADSLSPTFRLIAAYLINYYNIPPTR